MGISDWAVLDPGAGLTYDVLSGGSYRESEAGRLHSDIADPMDLSGAKAKEEREAAAGSAQALGYEALGMQKDWMDYIKSEYAPYSEVATEALGAQRGLAGLRGTGEREREIADIEADPFYQAKVRAGEEAVLRGASATGGLRSGNVQSALAGQNQALLGQEIDARYQQLAGLSGQGFMGQQAGAQFGGQALGGVTGTMGEIGSGMIASAAAGTAAQQEKTAGILGMVGGVASAFSDERLKTNIVKVGEKNGMPWYSWTWNETAENRFGLYGKQKGHMASDVALKHPDLIGEKDGYRTVNYGGLN